MLIFLAPSCMGFVLGHSVALAPRRRMQELRRLPPWSAAQVRDGGGHAAPRGWGRVHRRPRCSVCMAVCAVVSLGLVLAARR
ncbi:hypothetical protein QJS66_18095 [Kocuria rhizophila]|nr:hypothetical protein QJS66_18095 [Kocuria rhizophila]